MRPSPVELAKTHGTPVWIYDAEIIRRQIALVRRFDVVRFAQKSNSNLHLLRLMKEQGVVLDAVSLGEMERALRAGFDPKGKAADAPIVFTADVLDRPTLQRLVETRIPVNAGSPDMLAQLGAASPGHPVWLRINPGFGSGHHKKTNTGGKNSKHGIWFENLNEALALVDRFGLDLVGFHMHIGSGSDYGHLHKVTDAMVSLIRDSRRDVRALSAGGGLSIPYRPGDPTVDTAHYFVIWDGARKEVEKSLGHKVSLELEPGRFLVAQAGMLVGEIRAIKMVGDRQFILLDAGFNDLMRPAMYGAFHRTSLWGRDGKERTGGASVASVVAGPLCESGDVFTQDDHGEVYTVELPAAEVGDFIVLHDAGAYGASMSSNYNSRPFAPEVLVDGEQVKLIRRRQTIDELLSLES